MKDILRSRLDWMKTKVRECAADKAHELSLLRMRVEAWLSRFDRRKRGKRVLATACWHFPVYSQSFVYRELAQLASNNFQVRFIYSELASRSQLAREFSAFWRLRRRLILNDRVSARDLEHYRSRMPDKVAAAARLIGDASGLTVEEVLAHEHFRH